MKKLYTFLLAAASLAFLLSSCDKEVVHQPGEPDASGCYGVYFPSQTSSVTLDPSDPTTTSFTVARVNTSGAITVPVTLSGATDIMTLSDIAFADGQSETSCTVNFPKSEVGVSYTISLQITDEKYASKYNSQPIAFDYTIMREKWNSLGKATYSDRFMFSNSYEAELLQNDKNKNLFRLMDPMTAGLNAEGYVPDSYKAGPSPYIQFKLLQKGDVVGDVTISMSDLVYFDDFYTGFYNKNYSAEVQECHPSGFKKYRTSQENWAYNKVVQWQPDGKLPAAVQLAPFYYMDGVGGWDYSQEDGNVTIVFPGAVLTDYSLALQAGQSDDEGKLPVLFTLGTDVAKVLYSVYEGSLNVAQIERVAGEIGDGTEKNVKTVTATGVESITMDKTSPYTLVGVVFDAEGAVQNYQTVEFDYVAAGDDVPVVVNCGLVATNKYFSKGYTSDDLMEFYIVGTDISYLRYKLFNTSEVSGKNDDALMKMLSGVKAPKQEVLDSVNASGYVGVYTKLAAGTEYTLLVCASNGYETAIFTANAKTTGKVVVTMADMIGTYSASITSYFDGLLADPSKFKIEASDKAESGNVMFTVWDDLICAWPIYAQLDTINNTITVNDAQKFYHVNKWNSDLYYVTYDGTDSTVFTIKAVGVWGSPSGMCGIHILGEQNNDKTYQAYTGIEATKVQETSSVPAPMRSWVAKRSAFGLPNGPADCQNAVESRGVYETKSASFYSVPSSYSFRSFDRSSKPVEAVKFK